MEWVVTESAEVLKDATPDPFRPIVPSGLAPSLKVTVPVGVPEPGSPAATVAVKVTDWPKTEGFVALTTAVVVVARLTSCDGDRLPELAPKLALPPYATLTVWVPTVRVEVVKVACPEPFRLTGARA